MAVKISLLDFGESVLQQCRTNKTDSNVVTKTSILKAPKILLMKQSAIPGGHVRSNDIWVPKKPTNKNISVRATQP